MKAVKLVLPTYYKQFHMKAIHFQIYKTTAFSYLLKMGGNKNKYLLGLANLLHHGIRITAKYLPNFMNGDN